MSEHTPIRLIIGLGNPGDKYADTRHNVGQDWVQELAKNNHIDLIPEKRFFGRYGQGMIAGNKVHLFIPTTFMNLSGQAVQAVCAFYKIGCNSLLVVHDELDLPAGQARFKSGGGHGGHNGLRDIIAKAGGNKDFHRLRIGIGHPGHASQVSAYVLKKAPAQEYSDALAAMNKANACLEWALTGNWQKAMQCLHSP